MKPPFSYYGGKQRMAPKIVPLLPPHTVYVEPFFGSGAVLFEKGIPAGSSIHYREVINDKNDLLINFFRVLQDREQNKELCQRLEYTLYSRAEYDRAITLFKNPEADPVLMAWAWFVNICMSFAGKTSGGWGFSVVFRNHAETFRNERSRIQAYAERLQGVFVESRPAIEVIQRWDCHTALTYCDPPYPDTEQGHYSGFTQADFEELIGVLQECKGAVVLSCYDNPAVPSDWIKYEFEAVASSRGCVGSDRDHTTESKARAVEGTRRTECVWIKPASGEVRPELKAAMERHAGQRKQLSLFGEASA